MTRRHPLQPSDPDVAEVMRTLYPHHRTVTLAKNTRYRELNQKETA